VVQVERDLPKVLDLVSETRETRGLELMRVTIERAGRIGRKLLAGYMRRQMGMTRTAFLESEAQLTAEGCVQIDIRSDQYVWIKRVTTMPRTAADAKLEEE